MKYPVDKETFVEVWLENLKKTRGSINDNDRELTGALADVINSAYFAGVEDGRKQQEVEA